MIVVGSILATPAVAHQDPRGDVHPSVRVEDGDFVLEYSNSEDGLEYRRTIAANGAETGGPVRLDAEAGEARRRALQSRLDHAFRSEDLRIPKSFVRGEAPFIERRSADGEWIREELPWGPLEVDWITDAHAEDDALTFLLTLVGFEGLHVVQFRGEPLEIALFLDLGVPVSIYGFPVASEIVVTEDGYAVAWMTPERESSARPPECRGASVALSTWDRSSAEAWTSIVARGAHWNADISMAVVGSVFLIAYHRGSGADCLEDSRIGTVYVAFVQPRP